MDKQFSQSQGLKEGGQSVRKMFFTRDGWVSRALKVTRTTKWGGRGAVGRLAVQGLVGAERSHAAGVLD